MADLRVHSSTSNKFRLKLRSLSTGVGLTGLSSGSSGLIVSTITDNEATATAYTGSNLETVGTLGTFAAPTSGKARFREVDATNHPGLYEIQLADARFSVASARKIIISVSGATDLLDVDYEVQLTGFDPHDAVRLGLTALPNVASGNAGAILTSGTGTAQIAVSGGAVTTVTSVNTVNGIAGDAITANSIAAAAFTSAKFATGALQSATFADGFLTDAKVADDVTVRVGSWTTAGLAALFTSDSGETYADAVAGSVVKEIADNASGGGGGLTASDVWSHGTRTLTAATNITSTGGTITVSAGAVTVGTNNDKTGYSLTQGFPTNFASLLINASGHVSRVTLTDALTTNNDKTGYSLTQAFPANFDALSINASGHVSRVTLVDTLTTYTGDTPQTGDVYAALTGAQAEPGQGAPAVNASVLTKIAHLFKSWRNKKTQTATTHSLFADDGTTVDAKATVSDDGTTLTVGEIVTGP